MVHWTLIVLVCVGGLGTSHSSLDTNRPCLCRWARYQPWFIKLSLLDRRVQLAILVLPPLVVIILIGLALGLQGHNKGSFLLLIKMLKSPRPPLPPPFEVIIVGIGNCSPINILFYMNYTQVCMS